MTASLTAELAALQQEIVALGGTVFVEFKPDAVIETKVAVLRMAKQMMTNKKENK